MIPADSDKRNSKDHLRQEFAGLFRFVASFTGMVVVGTRHAELVQPRFHHSVPQAETRDQQTVHDPRAYRVALPPACKRQLRKQHPELCGDEMRLLETVATPTAICRDALFASRASYYKPVGRDGPATVYIRVTVDLHASGRGEIRSACLVKDKAKGEQQLWP